MINNNLKIFYREFKNNKQEVISSFKKILNLDNILKWKEKKIKKIINFQNYEDFFAYKFYILKLWINQNENYDLFFIEKLQKLLYSLNLYKDLNSLEKKYILFYINIVFAKTRKLKNIIVNFEMLNDEQTYFKYDVNFLIQQDFENKKFLENSNIYLTNQRIVIIDSLNIFNIFYNEIISFDIKDFYILIKTTQKDFKIVSSDYQLIYLSFQRILKKINLFL